MTWSIEPTAYVELVSVVAMAEALEAFCQALSLDGVALPAPIVDDSSVTGASETTVDSHWVPTVADVQPNIRNALSAAPAEYDVQGVLIDATYVPGEALAGDMAGSQWPLQRTQIELIASRTSTPQRVPLLNDESCVPARSERDDVGATGLGRCRTGLGPWRRRSSSR